MDNCAASWQTERLPHWVADWLTSAYIALMSSLAGWRSAQSDRQMDGRTDGMIACAVESCKVCFASWHCHCHCGCCCHHTVALADWIHNYLLLCLLACECIQLYGCLAFLYSLCVVCASIHVGWLVSHLRKRVNATGIRFVGFAHEVVKQIVGVDTARVRLLACRSQRFARTTNPRASYLVAHVAFGMELLLIDSSFGQSQYTTSIFWRTRVCVSVCFYLPTTIGTKCSARLPSTRSLWVLGGCCKPMPTIRTTTWSFFCIYVVPSSFFVWLVLCNFIKSILGICSFYLCFVVFHLSSIFRSLFCLFNHFIIFRSLTTLSTALSCSFSLSLSTSLYRALSALGSLRLLVGGFIAW